MKGKIKTASAIGLVALALAEGVAPDPVIRNSTWTADNVIVADGPFAGQKWKPDETPQLVEILDCLGPDHPCNEVTVKKSSQVGYTMTAIGWLATIIDHNAAQTLVVMPTLEAGREFNAEKFQPVLDDTPALRRKAAAVKSRSSLASTTTKKRFPGGSITITGANSTVDLRSKTVKYVVADEIDDWPLDLNGQGDPMEMVAARQRSFLATGEWKILRGSTPTIKGSSQIEDRFESGDQRHWNVKCPHCGHEQKLVFKNLKFEKTYPHKAFYQCAANGCIIEHHHKRTMVQAGQWVAEKPGPGRHPSFHLDTLSSLLVTWDDIAKAWLDAQGKPEKLKTFVNLWLGETWEERGEAPEWERLYARRDTYPAMMIPVGGLLLTAAADVQQDGIYYEVVAWGRDKQSWSIDIGFLEGDTADDDSEAWKKLDAVYERTYRDAYGNDRSVDAFAVDSGYRSNTVYLWTRARPRTYAIKGDDGWHKAAIASSPSSVEVTHRGKKKRRGAKVWPIGTWPLKAELYAYLRKLGRRDGHEEDPYGYCHFSEQVHDEAYFKQLTAEFLKESTNKKGRKVREWYATGPNHYHDCRVYNQAMAARLGVGAKTPEQWDAIVAERTQVATGQRGLLDDIPPAPPPPTSPSSGTASPPPPPGGGLSDQLA